MMLAVTACSSEDPFPRVEAEARTVESGPTADWAVREIVPGLSLYEGEISRGTDPGWHVSLSSGSGWFSSRDEAEKAVDRIASHGYPARVVEIAWPMGFVRGGEVFGWKVLLEQRYATEQQARAAAQEFPTGEWQATAEWAGAEVYEDFQHVRAALAVVDPALFLGRMYPTYGSGIDTLSTVSEIAQQEQALLAVNAGYFVMETEDGIPGDPAGLGVYGGRLESEATEGRPAVVLEEGLGLAFEELTTEARVSFGGAVRAAEGINRYPGRRRNCVDEADPTPYPLHDVTCLVPSELVVFTDATSGRTPSTDGFEVVVDAAGAVVSAGAPGALVPEGGYVIQGTDDAARWLEEHGLVGAVCSVETAVLRADGQKFPLDGTAGVINTGPLLIQDGRITVDAERNGLVHPGDPWFVHNWGMKAHPRMLLGEDENGRLLMLGVSGREPGAADGLGLHEAAEFMRDLGAVDAVALDGGGSVTMVVGGETVLLGDFSEGERPVGDALVLTAG